jgi:twitching motility protein PilT
MILAPSLLSLLNLAIEYRYSDLHLSVGSGVIGRLHGDLVTADEAIWTEDRMNQLIEETLSVEEKQILREKFSLDAAISAAQQRFRINIYGERGHSAWAIRRLQRKIPLPEDLNLPSEVVELTNFPHGLVLFTGPTGSGKSTSLAALLSQINEREAVHIITIEDPIEYLHENKRALVHQRELGTDVVGFAEALREALREDPDVILVGEMRDLATMRAAITAAETGHLVFSTLHCGDTVGALDRILAMYPADEQDSIRRQLGMTLRAVVAQALLPRADSPGRVPAVEVLRCTNAVQNHIRTAQFSQIYSTLETGRSQGMISLDHSLASLVQRRMISRETAEGYVRNARLFQQTLAAQGRSHSRTHTENMGLLANQH